MENRFINHISLLLKALIFIFGLSLVLLFLSVYQIYFPQTSQEQLITESVPKPQPDLQIVSGIHKPTGLIDDIGLVQVINNCTNCHSAQIIIQNRASREGWKGLIKWMQQTQNLWDLGENETIILDYLGKNYAPEKKGRRSNIHEVAWYPYEGN